MNTRSSFITASLLTCGLVVAGCGSVEGVYDWDGYVHSDGGIHGDGYVAPDVDYSSTGSISGTVWLPGNGPGQVTANHEIPVFDALVYLSSEKPEAMPRSVYCEQCVDPPSRYVTTDHQGQFIFTNVFAGTYWLVIQKGHFRLSQQITIAEREDLELTPQQSTLPSVQDYDNGKEIPNIALASGVYDSMEDILGKMGIGSVDSSGGFNGSSAAGNFAVYSNGGMIDNVAIAPLTQLVEDYNTLSQYHILFIPCSYQTYGGVGLSGAPVTVLQNLRQFVSDGGKLYVTDWSGEYVDNVFPEQIRFASDHDTPPAAWSGTAWNSSLFSDSDGSPSYTSEHALALDPDIASWLHGQYGPIIDGWGTYSEGTYDASAFEVEGNWDHIAELVPVQLGLDGEGFPIIDTPRSFIIGDENGSPATCVGNTGCNPLTVTFEPVGCGRVLYSTYHTTESTHTGLVPQERVLAYLIMEIGVCKSGPIVR